MKRFIVRSFEYGVDKQYHVSAESILDAITHVEHEFSKPLSFVYEVCDENGETLWWASNLDFRDFFFEYMEQFYKLD